MGLVFGWKMNCCSKELVIKRILNMDTRAIVLKYKQCKECKKNYDLKGNEIVIRGTGYKLKKDCVDPFL